MEIDQDIVIVMSAKAYGRAGDSQVDLVDAMEVAQTIRDQALTFARKRMVELAGQVVEDFAQQ